MNIRLERTKHTAGNHKGQPTQVDRQVAMVDMLRKHGVMTPKKFTELTGMKFYDHRDTDDFNMEMILRRRDIRIISHKDKKGRLSWSLKNDDGFPV